MKALFSAIILITIPFSVLCQVKKPEPAPVKVPFTESLQAVVVVTKDWNATQGTARRYERKSRKAKWKSVGESFPVVVGRSGLGWTEQVVSSPGVVRFNEVKFKREGDGRSPIGLFPLTFAFGSAMKPEQLTFPYTRLEEYTECVDDENSHHYNKVVNRMKVGIFDWKSSEKMLEVGPQYDLGVFVAYNSYPVEKGRGSCIFLHNWKNPDSPTSGCTAMERTNLERIVSWLDAAKNPYLVQFPEKQYRSLRKSWNLPKLK